jgi:hypothetical protein
MNVSKVSTDERAERGAIRVITAAFMHDVEEGNVLKVGNYTRYTAAQRREFLDGLEAVALGTAAPDGPTRARGQRQAAMMLAAVGLGPDITAPERHEIPRRLLRVFEESRDREARQAAASWLGDLLALAPPESPRIVAALMRAARASGAEARIDPSVAVQALMFGGEIGNNAMRRLHEEGGVHGESARMWLNSHARHGFPVRRRYPVAPGSGPGG